MEGRLRGGMHATCESERGLITLSVCLSEREGRRREAIYLEV